MDLEQSSIRLPKSILSKWTRYRKSERNQQLKHDWLTWCLISSKTAWTSTPWQTALWLIRLFIKVEVSSLEVLKANHRLRESMECSAHKKPIKRSSWPTECENRQDMVVLVEPTDHWASTRWTRRKQGSCCNQIMIREYMRCCPLLEARRSNRCSIKPNLGSAKVELAITAKWARISRWGRPCSMAILWIRWDRAMPAKTIQHHTASNMITTRLTGTLN